MAIGTGCHPVRAVALPDSSSAARKAWLRKGSPGPAQRSQSAASNEAIPRPSRATISLMRRLEDDLIGMSGRPGPVRLASNRPGIDRHSTRPRRASEPGGQIAYIVGEEVGPGAPQGQGTLDPAPQPALAVLGHDEAARATGRASG